MNKIICTLALLFSFFIGYSQTKLDSLVKEFEATTNDSLKFERLDKIISIVKKKDNSLLKKYATIGIELATELNDANQLLDYQVYYSQFLKKDSSDSKTIDYLENVLRNSKSGDNKHRVFAINNLATLYTESNQIEMGAKAYKEAIRISALIDYKKGIASSTIGIVTLLMSQKMYEDAKPYLYKSITGCDALEAPVKYGCAGVAFHNLGLYFNKTKQYDSSIFYVQKSIEAKEKINNLPGIIVSLQLKGNSELGLEDTIAAISTTINAIELARKSPRFKSILIGSLLHLGNIYEKQKDMKKTYAVWEEIEINKSSIKKSEDLLNYYTLKVNVLAHQNRRKEAMAVQKLQYELKDSIRNSKNIAIVSEMENKYETEKLKKEMAIADLATISANEKAANSRKNNIYIIGFTLLILILLTVLFSRFSIIKKQKKELDAAYAQLEISKKNELAVSNLKALQSQMNPHFIFNALNSVQDLVLLQDIRSSNKYLGKFSDLIRMILLSSKKQFISLEEEVKILELYLDLEKLRFGDDFNIDFKVDLTEEDLSSIELPAMFIQPYIENAIKHGLFHKAGPKELKLQFTKNKSYLICVVEDNGVGQEKSKEYKEKNLHLHTGFSTEAINDRIRLLNETLKKKIILETIDLIENNEALGTKIILKFPV
jgi:hypothetical protein